MASQKETIGRCDGCTLIDHHLIDGLCPVCRNKGGEGYGLTNGTDAHSINWGALKHLLAVPHIQATNELGRK